MFLRWRHRKNTTRRTSSVYVWKKGHPLAGQPVVTENTVESWTIAVVESHRVHGEPRTRVVAHLGSFRVAGGWAKGLPGPKWYVTRTMLRRIRALDIPTAEKKRFLREIEQKGGVQFEWPASLEPMTDEEFDAETDALESALAERIQRKT